MSAYGIRYFSRPSPLNPDHYLLIEPGSPADKIIMEEVKKRFGGTKSFIDLQRRIVSWKKEKKDQAQKFPIVCETNYVYDEMMAGIEPFISKIRKHHVTTH